MQTSTIIIQMTLMGLVLIPNINPIINPTASPMTTPINTLPRFFLEVSVSIVKI
jgi:hypothetical protein